MKRVVSGIQPSGELTIGNYLGAMKRWPDNQETQESFFFVANLHAITIRQDPDELRRRTLDVVAWLLTTGVNPDVSTIFIQSQVKAHSEITWILNNFATLGELNKMTQFKDKSTKLGREGQYIGLFDYPVLMAGDVLIYDADEVPVGDDQVQHLELARNIAVRFNNAYGYTFKEPKPSLSATAKRILSLTDPESKMSKSDSSESYVSLSDTADVIVKKFKRAVTDSANKIRYSDDQPAIKNLLTIYSGFSGEGIEEIVKKYENSGYGKFKTDLGELVAGKLIELQKTFEDIRENDKLLADVTSKGFERASEIADKKIEDVKNKLGLL